MLKDPFYLLILERLNGSLDPDVFEHCATDLLRQFYPSISFVPGGKDNGMDGAIAETDNDSFPLITTTSEDVIGNLTRSLKAYLESDWKNRKAILATSKVLSKNRINNLKARATEIGFILLQVYTQVDMAALLYRNPRWCRDLLNLSCDPSPLSVIPLTRRPLFQLKMIGRVEDFSWLLNNKEDRVICGQPGSGKTFLLYNLALEGKALFAISRDRVEITANIRKEKPEAIIVDDAHTCDEIIIHLRQIRESTGANFSIIASCWPSYKEQIISVLCTSSKYTRELDLLSRDEIAEVINEAGIHGPSWLVRELVDQAEGRPGLAITLSQHCLLGDIESVAYGRVISDQLLRSFTYDEKAILASFSIGANRGLPVDIVASFLELNRLNVLRSVDKLAAAGIIYDRNDSLSVRPAILRYSLIKDIFFSGAKSLLINDLLGVIPNLGDAVQTLIGAKSRSAAVDGGLLIKLLEDINNDVLWEQYAWLGVESSNWILDKYPDKIIFIAKPALLFKSNNAIPLLLDLAIGDKRPLNSNPNHPLRLLKEWIVAGKPGTGQAIERRILAFHAVKCWLEKGGDLLTGYEALESVFSPMYEEHSVDPGSGNRITMFFGIITTEEVDEIIKLWRQFLPLIDESKIQDWSPICAMITNWVYPLRSNLNVEEKDYKKHRAFAIQIINDVSEVANGRIGIIQWLRNLVIQKGIVIDLPYNQEIDVLYPIEEISTDHTEVEKKQALKVRSLATIWHRDVPAKIVKKIKHIEDEASSVNLNWPRYTTLLFSELSRIVTSKMDWLIEMLNHGLPNDLMIPFFEEAALKKEKGWDKLASDCLKSESTRYVSIKVILTHPDPPRNIVDEAIKYLDGYERSIEHLCFLGKITEGILIKLLKHGNNKIAGAAAIGMWQCDPKGEIPGSMKDDWCDVIVSIDYAEYWLEEILSGNKELAISWIYNIIATEHFHYLRYEDILEGIFSSLDYHSKLKLLHGIIDGDNLFIGRLINDDVTLYSELLKIDELKNMHLAPLERLSGKNWIEKAKLALNKGYTVEEITANSFPVYYSWSGNESNMWLKIEHEFEKLMSDDNLDMQSIGELGKAKSEQLRNKALELEKHERIFGY